MRTNHVGAGFTPALLLFLALPALAQEGETYDLTPRYTLGDKQETEARVSQLLKVRMQVKSQKLDHTSEEEQVIVRRYTDELTKVEDGKVDQVERKFAVAWTGVRDAGAARLARRLDPVHQRTIVIGRDAKGKRKVWPRHGDLPREAIANEMPTERYEAALPNRAVAVGERWEVKGKEFLRAYGSGLGKDPQGSMACTLREVREEALDEGVDPVRYAIIDVVVEASGRQAPAADAPLLSISLKGELRFALELRKIASVHLRGEGRVTQRRVEGAAEVLVDGAGPLEIKKRIWFPAKPRRKK